MPKNFENSFMREKTNIGKPVHSFLTSDIEGAGSLEELALDLRWSWNYAACTWGPEESNSFFNPGHHWSLPTEINEKNAGK